MIVVGDASAFIALQRIEAEHLLPAVYGHVHVPDAVWREVFASKESVEVPPSWVVRHTVPRGTAADLWPEQLDEGETEAILLARDLSADLLLIDEATGRAVARRLGLAVTGVVGLLLDAKQQQKIDRVRPLLERLRTAGFWIAESVFQAALARAQEQ